MPLTVLSILLHRAVARDVHFGDKSCYLNSSHYTGHDDDADGSGNVQDKTKECADQKNSTQCLALAPQCEWNYSGVGVQYQASEKTPLKVNSSDPRKPSPHTFVSAQSSGSIPIGPYFQNSRVLINFMHFQGPTVTHVVWSQWQRSLSVE